MLRLQLARDTFSSAVATYRGELLPGLETGGWVARLRDELRASLRVTLHGLIQEAREREDYAQVVLLCTQGLKVDPGDTELAELRLEIARFVSTPQEQIKFKNDIKNRPN